MRAQEAVTLADEALSFFVKATDKDNIDNNGYHHSRNDNIVLATDAVIGRKLALVCSHCDVGEGCAFDFPDSGALVSIVHSACIEVLQVAAIESVVCETDIIVRVRST